ncbi:MAG: hypothetical protein ACRCXD_12025 [Luteolibacter sp.]
MKFLGLIGFMLASAGKGTSISLTLSTQGGTLEALQGLETSLRIQSSEIRVAMAYNEWNRRMK